MKTLTTLILAITIIACNTEEVHTQNYPIQKPIEKKVIPEWLQGKFVSRFYPKSNETEITKDIIYLDLTVFDVLLHTFRINLMETEETENAYHVIYDEVIEVMFYKNDDPSNTDIKISYIEDGVIYEYGWFKKLD